MQKKLRHGVLAILLLTAFLGGKRFCESHMKAPSLREMTLSPEQSRAQTLALTRFHFGFRHVLADLIWVRLLQLNDHRPVESDKVSWEYGQLEALIKLDPHFSRAYSFGSTFLTILRQDKLGARFISERWALRYPNNYRPLLMLGFLHYHDLNDHETGAKYMLRAATMPYAPQFLSALGIRLASRSGANSQNLAMSIELYDSIPIEESRERLLLRIRDLHYEIQKTAWEEAVRAFREERKRAPASIDEIQTQMNARLADSAMWLPKEVAPEIARVLSKKYRFRYNSTTNQIESDTDGASDLGQLRIYPKEGKIK